MEARISKRNFVTVMFVGFVNYLEWSIVMASIFPFIKKISHLTQESQQQRAQVFLALAQSLFPLGQGLSQAATSLAVKRLREVKVVLIVTLIIAVGGNAMYMSATIADSVILIIAGRAVAGLGAGSGGVAYCFIGANTPRESRAKYMGYYRAICMLGVLIGTIVATLLADFEKTNVGKATGLNECTAPVVISITCLVASLFLVVLALDESNYILLGDVQRHISTGFSIPNRGVILCLMLFFLNGFITTWVGYIMQLIAYNHLGWHLEAFGWLTVGVSAAASMGSLGTTFLAKSECFRRDGERTTITISYVFMVIGIMAVYLSCPMVMPRESSEFQEVTFVSGVVVVFLMYSVCGVVLPCLTTKFVDKTMIPVIMPHCLAAMSCGKVMAPLLAKAELLLGWDAVFLAFAGYHIGVRENTKYCTQFKQKKKKSSVFSFCSIFNRTIGLVFQIS
ncbi:predicted protein [Nematostella vectensis]|uniref:Major facilitator superfamily (MFS) profile domain-containing protein n=1 Tax=Nematostella vectensis TaxID=45351 RepID=A7RRP8_NEMVE|nr:predicted protein [Nematostella vectensis]|eukprot:XP_001637861.1 predicted protein [Nematostella vectensis]